MSLNQSLEYSGEAKVIYFHCSAGIDRTGYLSAAYQMKHLNKPLKECYEENLAVMSKLRDHMHFNTFNGLKWYCLSLGRNEKECMIGEEQKVISQQ